MHHARLDLYHDLLAASSELSDPVGRIAFTMLTALVSPDELFHPATRVEHGHLAVTGPRARRVPIAHSTTQVLGPGDAPVRSLLGIGAANLFTLEDLDLMEDSPGPFAEVPSCRLHAVATEALVVAASDHNERRAVLRYAGLPVDGRLSPVVPDRLADVAAHIDQQVRDAGLRV